LIAREAKITEPENPGFYDSTPSLLILNGNSDIESAALDNKQTPRDNHTKPPGRSVENTKFDGTATNENTWP